MLYILCFFSSFIEIYFIYCIDNCREKWGRAVKRKESRVDDNIVIVTVLKNQKTKRTKIEAKVAQDKNTEKNHLKVHLIMRIFLKPQKAYINALMASVKFYIMI